MALDIVESRYYGKYGDRGRRRRRPSQTSRKLAAIRGDVRVPRRAVTSVRVVDNPFAELHGWRVGTAIPGVIGLGSMKYRDGTDFMAVYRGKRGVVIDLTGAKVYAHRGLPGRSGVDSASAQHSRLFRPTEKVAPSGGSIPREETQHLGRLFAARLCVGHERNAVRSEGMLHIRICREHGADDRNLTEHGRGEDIHARAV